MLKDITVESIENILKPETLATTYQAKAPFVFNILHTFSASPNPYRTKKARKAGGKGDLDVDDVAQKGLLLLDDSDEEEENMDGEIGSDSKWKKKYPGLSRNPLLVCVYFGKFASEFIFCAGNCTMH